MIKKKLGLKHFHFHSLRHTHGTILAENGATPNAIKDRLGHKSIETTLERYVFTTDKMENDTLRIFEEYLAG